MKIKLKYKYLLFALLAFFHSCKDLDTQNFQQNYKNEDFVAQAKRALESSKVSPDFKNVNWDNLLLGYPVLDSLGDQYLNFSIEKDPSNKNEPLCTIITFKKRKGSDQIEIYPWKVKIKKENENEFNGEFHIYTPEGKLLDTYSIEKLDLEKYPIKKRLVKPYNPNKNPTLYNGNSESSLPDRNIYYDNGDMPEVVVRGRRNRPQADPFERDSFGPPFGMGGFGSSIAMQQAEMMHMRQMQLMQMHHHMMMVEAAEQAEREAEKEKEREVEELKKEVEELKEKVAKEKEKIAKEKEKIAKEKEKIAKVKKLEREVAKVKEELEIKTAVKKLLDSGIIVEAGRDFTAFLRFGKESDPPYKFLIRSFGAFEYFGLSSPFARGEFYGDNRGFSTDLDATARAHQTILIDEDYKLSTYARSDDARLDTEYWFSKVARLIPDYGTNFNKTSMSATPRAEITKDLELDIQNGFKVVSLATSLKASNPYIDSAPAIRVYADLSIKDDQDSLEIKAKLNGSNFPSTEIFYEDTQGPLFLGVGFYEGSVWGLLKSKAKKDIMDSHIKYKDKDARGVFRTVEDKIEGKTYTREEWNKMVENLDPHKNAKGKQKR